MLQSMGSHRVRHDLATEQEQIDPKNASPAVSADLKKCLVLRAPDSQAS